MTLHPRELRATWTTEAADDLYQQHLLPLTPEQISERSEASRVRREVLEQRLTEAFAEEIGREIDEELIADLRAAGQRVVAQHVADTINYMIPGSPVTFAINQYTTSSKDDEYINWKEFGF